MRSLVRGPSSRAIRCLAALLAVLSLVPAGAEPLRLGPVEVVASHLLDEPGFGPRPSIVDRDEIQRRGAVSMTDLLRTVTGVDVTQQGGPGGLSFVSIRGGDPNFTLFLIDGVRINDPTNTRGGGVDLSTLDPGMVERIEVYRGSLSTARGSTALSGVINIVTRQGDTGRLGGASARGDSSGGHRLAVHANGGTPDAGTWSFAGGRTRGGTDIPGDSLRRNFGSARAQTTLDGALDLGLQASISEGAAEAFPEDSGGPRLAVLRETERREFWRTTLSTDAQLEVSPALSARAGVNWSHLDENTDNPGIASGALPGVPPLASDRRFDSVSADISATLRPRPQFSVSAGVQYLLEDGRSKDTILLEAPLETRFSLRRDTVGVFLEGRWRPVPGASLEASVRRDHPSTHEPVHVYRAAVGYEVASTGTEFSASWGEGFKLPSFFALGNLLVGNPDLEAERSTQGEIGLRQSALDGRVTIDVNLFRVRYRDLVDFDPLLFTNVNRGLVKVNGLETEFRAALWEPLRVGGHGTYQRIDVVGEAAELRRRPAWKAGGFAEWLPGAGNSLRLDVSYSGEFADSSIPTGPVDLPGYWRVDLAGRLALGDQAHLGVTVRNLLDEQFEETAGFPGPERRVALELELRL